MEAPDLRHLIAMIQEKKQAGEISYHVEGTTVPDGLMKGKVLLQIKPEGSHNLLNFPPEIRNRVYTEIFAKDCPTPLTVLSKCNTKNSRRPSKVVSCRRSHHFTDEGAHVGQQYIAATGTWAGRPPSEFSLLLANKKINKEATPLAYGLNCFEFTGVRTVFTHWENQTGQNLKHVTAIYLSDVDNSFDFKLLLKFSSLRTIYIPAGYILGPARYRFEEVEGSHGNEKAENLTRRVKRVLMSLQASYKAQDRTWRALDVVQFKLPPNPHIDLSNNVEAFKPLFRQAANVYLEEG